MEAIDNSKHASVPAIQFIVTGFGPFHGVTDNPTEAIAMELVEYLDTSPTYKHLAKITKTLVFETSAASVKEELDRLHQELCLDSHQSPEPVTILLHLGVNSSGTFFQLERCAYNNASFRVPDERGYRPDQECIIDHYGLECCLRSRLDVAELVKVMNQTNDMADSSSKHSCSEAIESNDPGRFVCNYAYCYSLVKFNGHYDCEASRFRSLFLHVPPLSVAAKMEQMMFVARLMDAIHRQLCSYS